MMKHFGNCKNLEVLHIEVVDRKPVNKVKCFLKSIWFMPPIKFNAHRVYPWIFTETECRYYERLKIGKFQSVRGKAERLKVLQENGQPKRSP